MDEPRHSIVFPFSLFNAYIIRKTLNISMENHLIKICMNNLMGKNMLNPHLQRTYNRFHISAKPFQLWSKQQLIYR